MKKYFVLFIAFCLFIVPWKVNAAEITDTSITGISEARIGEEVSLTFQIHFSGLNMSDPNSLGIWFIAYELDFDDTTLLISDISSTAWDSVLTSIEGKTYVVSEIRPTAKDMCMNGAVFCGDYAVAINFFIKKTDKTSSTIKICEVGAALLDIQDKDKVYGEEDIIEIETISKSVHTIKIKQLENESSTVEEPDALPISPSGSSHENKVIVPPEKPADHPTSTYKSTNSYLTSLEIENYPIDFKKVQKDYTVMVDKEVNSLRVKAVCDDEKATYKVIGADDLKANDYTVLVEVTAENGKKSTYTIRAQEKDEDNTVDTVTSISKAKQTDFVLEKKHIIAIGCFTVLIILVCFIIYRNHRKLDKALDEL